MHKKREALDQDPGDPTTQEPAVPGELCKKPFVAFGRWSREPPGRLVTTVPPWPASCLALGWLWMQSISQMPLDNFLPLVDRN